MKYQIGIHANDPSRTPDSVQCSNCIVISTWEQEKNKRNNQLKAIYIWLISWCWCQTCFLQQRIVFVDIRSSNRADAPGHVPASFRQLVLRKGCWWCPPVEASSIAFQHPFTCLFVPWHQAGCIASCAEIHSRIFIFLPRYPVLREAVT